MRGLRARIYLGIQDAQHAASVLPQADRELAEVERPLCASDGATSIASAKLLSSAAAAGASHF